MIEYLSNTEYWTFELGIRSIGAKSWAITFLIAVWLWRSKHPVRRHIYRFVVFTLLMEHVSTDTEVSALINPDTNAPWYHMGAPILFLLLSQFYTDYLFKEKWQPLEWILPLGFALFALWYATLGVGFNNFPSTALGLYCGAGILFPIAYFIGLLQNPKIQYLEDEPMFWISAGMLIYYSGNFLIWVGLKFITYDFDLFNSIYRITGGLTLFLNVFLCIALLLTTKSPILKPST